MGVTDFIRETVADTVAILRDPTDEQKAIIAAVLGMAIIDRVAWYYDIPFVVRTTMAVMAGFAVLFVVSYAITGEFVPPDEEDDEEFDTEL